MRSLALFFVLALVGCGKDLDEDGDGYTVEEGGDCDDSDASVHPDADELCNGVDDDCDGDVDEQATDRPTWHEDADGDGYGEASESKEACTAPEGWVDDATDCNDRDAGVHPGADELCDGVDQDCDGSTDEDATNAPTWYADEDGDGYGIDSTTTEACDQPEGYAADGGDCDDTVATAHPGMWERCSTDYDDDCDGEVNEDSSVDAPNWYVDADGDGYGLWTEFPHRQCLDPGEGWSANDEDCDDTQGDISPAATELCDEVDNDCDGDTDEGDAVDAPTWYRDADEDGYGDPDHADTYCVQPSGWLADATDCDDTDSEVYPGRPEECDDGTDQDCDGTVDNGCHCGLVASDETWAASENHVVWCDVVVYDLSAPVLTIEDGATVYFDSGTDLVVGVSGPGSVDVQGTTTGVVFTSYASTPSQGDWSGVTIGEYDQGSTLTGLTLEYGGTAATAGLTLDSADAVITGSLIQYNAGGGVLIAGSAQPAITGTEISGNDGTGVYAPSGGLSTTTAFEDNTLTYNTGYPMVLPATYAPYLDDSSTYTGNLDDLLVLESGTVTSTGTLQDLDVPWYLDGTLSVGGSASPVLTLADGVEVQATSSGSIQVGTTDSGSLVVDGTSTGVTLTSSATTPAAGDWAGITFGTYDEGSQLTGLSIEYGGSSGNGCLYLVGASVEIDDSTVSDCAYHGLYATGGAELLLTDSTLADNALDGVYLDSDALLARDTSPTFTGNTLDGNGAYPLTLPAASVGMVGTNTMSDSGYDYLRVLADDVETDATWLTQDVPLLVAGDVRVQGSTEPTLTLEDGQDLVFASGAGLLVGSSYPGSLVAVGTTTGIFFSGQGATAGSWDGLTFGAYTDTAWLESVSIEHGGANGFGALYVSGSYVLLVDSLIDDSDPNGVYVASGYLDASDSAITDSRGTGVYVSSTADLAAFDSCESSGHDDYPLSLPPASVGVLDSTSTLTGNGVDGVLVQAGVVSQDATWAALDVPYLVGGTVRVNSSATPVLELEAGTTLQFGIGASLMAGSAGPGALWAVGTSADPITFTSAQATPGAGDWSGLYLGNLCDDTLTVLGYTTVEYGGSNGLGNIVFDACDGTISDSTTQYSSTWGLYRLNGASPSISDMTWTGNSSGALY